MTSPPPLAALLVLLAAGCGDAEPPAAAASASPPAAATQATRPERAATETETETAVTPPAPDAPGEQAGAASDDEAGLDTAVDLRTPVVPPAGLVRLVVIAEHTLLRSEERTVDGIVRGLQVGDVRVERVEAAELAAPLTTWLTTAGQMERRAALGTALPPADALRAGADALVLLRVLPPDGRRSQGVGAFAVLAGAPLREVVFGDGPLSAEAASALGALLTEAP